MKQSPTTSGMRLVIRGNAFYAHEKKPKRRARWPYPVLVLIALFAVIASYLPKLSERNMDASSPQNTRTSFNNTKTLTMNHQKVTPISREAIEHIANQNRRELNEAYQAGRQQGSTDSWTSGAKIGAFCGVLLGATLAVAFQIGAVLLKL